MRLSPVGLAALFMLGIPTSVLADPSVYGYVQSGYRFAGPAIEGAYLGAPFTRLPSPNRIVPLAWGYGTYGIPTIAGIRDTPVARPTVTIVENRAPAASRVARRGGARILSKQPSGTWTEPPPRSEADSADVQVVSVQVPGR